MAQLKIFKREFGQQVFLSLQMLKRHHLLAVEREGRTYLGLVRPVSDWPGDVLIVIPDPRWPESEDGRATRLRPEDAMAFDVRLASPEQGQALIGELVDELYP